MNLVMEPSIHSGCYVQRLVFFQAPPPNHLGCGSQGPGCRSRRVRTRYHLFRDLHKACFRQTIYWTRFTSIAKGLRRQRVVQPRDYEHLRAEWGRIVTRTGSWGSRLAACVGWWFCRVRFAGIRPNHPRTGRVPEKRRATGQGQDPDDQATAQGRAQPDPHSGRARSRVETEAKGQEEELASVAARTTPGSGNSMRPALLRASPAIVGAQVDSNHGGPAQRAG